MPSRSDVIYFAKRLKDEISEDDLSGAAAELAYRFFLALFPFFIFLAALSGFVANNIGVADPTSEIMDMLGDSLPDDSASVIETQVRGVVDQRSTSLLSVGILGALWASASGVGTLMKVMNRIHEVRESRSTPKRLGIAIGLTIAGAGVLVLAFVVLFVGQLYGPEIAAEVNLEGTTSDILSYARWPAAFALIILAVGFIYWLAPNTPLPLKFITPGAIFFAVSWIVASVGLGFYVANFGSYNATYGALGGVVVLMLWFYVTSFLLLLGVEVNGLLAERALESPVRKAGDQGTQVVQQQATKPVGFAVVGLVWVLALAQVLRRGRA